MGLPKVSSKTSPSPFQLRVFTYGNDNGEVHCHVMKKAFKKHLLPNLLSYFKAPKLHRLIDSGYKLPKGLMLAARNTTHTF